MKTKGLVTFLLCVVCSAAISTFSFAGTGKVRFGAYTSGQGCSGTGICQTGSAGAHVIFNYSESLDTLSGGTFTTLTMLVNYDMATANGFTGDVAGGTYTFTGGYTFNHAGDKNTGVPDTYSIPNNYMCTYMPKDVNGMITLAITRLIPIPR